MDNNDLIYKIWLSTSLSNVASTTRKVLYKLSPKLAYEATFDEMTELGIKETVAQKLSDKNLDHAEKIIQRCEKLDIKIIPFDSPHYPRSLDRLTAPPFMLYVRGSLDFLLGKKTAGFVGTRKLSEVGEETGIALANELIGNGKILISGGAAGADSIASRTSADKNAPSIIVSGVDADKFSPAANEHLFRKVYENGAVVSEYPPYSNAHFFPERNRIIAALSDEVYVVEASASSGSIITGKDALKMKIPVYTFDLDGTSFDGCRELIQLGAKVIMSSKSSPKKTVVKSVTKNPKPKKKIPDCMTGLKLHIMETLLKGPAYDETFMTDEYKASDVIVTLTELELDGYIKALPGGRYDLANNRLK